MEMQDKIRFSRVLSSQVYSWEEIKKYRISMQDDKDNKGWILYIRPNRQKKPDKNVNENCLFQAEKTCEKSISNTMHGGILKNKYTYNFPWNKMKKLK